MPARIVKAKIINSPPLEDIDGFKLLQHFLQTQPMKISRRMQVVSAATQLQTNIVELMVVRLLNLLVR